MRKTLIFLVLALVAAACSQQAIRTNSPATTGSPVETTEVTLYYLVSSPARLWLAPERHRVRSTPAIAQAALEELVHGTAQDPDHTTPYPRAAKVNSVVIRDAVATVDWSADVLTASAGSETERLAIQSVVYTLTEFSTISKVRFTVEGKESGAASNGRSIEDWWGSVGLAGQPWTREAAVDVLEPITLWTPLQNATSTGTILLSGDASTFEANVGIVLRNASGKVVVQTSTTALEAAPGRGAFSKSITFTAPAASETWTLQVIEDSAKDGSVRFMEDRAIRVG